MVATTTEEGEDLWNQILNANKGPTSPSSSTDTDTSTDTSRDAPISKIASFKRTLLVLGDRNSGKTSLLAQLEAKQDGPRPGSLALGYDYIELKDEDEELAGTLDIWTFEGEVGHDNLLSFALNENNFHSAVAMITLDYSQPWRLAESLRKWLGVLKSHISSFENKLPPDFNNRLRGYVNSYTEPPPLTLSPNNSPAKKLSKKSKRKVNPELLRPKPPPSPSPLNTSSFVLEDTTDPLVFNLGIPIIVVICKTDSIRSLEKEIDLKEDKQDYIQIYLRRLCLGYGASLVYISSKNGTNVELLSDYLEHRLFGFEFTFPPQLAEKDAIFVPSGWDKPEKIKTDFANLDGFKGMEDAFESAIKKPRHIKKKELQPIIVSEKDQDFLQRHKTVIDTEEPKSATPISSTTFASGISLENLPFMAPAGAQSRTFSPLRSTLAKKDDSKEVADTTKDKKVLAEFFTSLMTNKGDKNSIFTLRENATKE